MRHILVLLALALPLALAQTTEQQLQQEVARNEQLLRERQAERQRIEAALAGTRQDIDRRLAELEQISNQLADLRQQRRDLQAAIAALEASIQATLGRIAEEQQNLENLTARVQRLMVNLYQQPNRNMRVLARSESLFDLRVRNHYLALLTDQDVNLLIELEATLARLAAEQLRLGQERDALAQREAELRVNEEALQASEAQVAQALANLRATEQGQQALRLTAIQQQDQISAALNQSRSALAAERARLERERQEAIRRAEEARRRAEEERRRQAEEEARQRAALEQAQRDATAAARAVAERAGRTDQAETALQQAEQEVRRIEEQLEKLEIPTRQAESSATMPVSNPRIQSRFGEGGATFIALRTDQSEAPVRAAMSGVVTNAARISANTGYVVVVQHAPNRCTSYTNLQVPLVRVGARVNQGEIIGYLGGGGTIRPDVLHFYVSGGNNCSVFSDPAGFLGIR